MVDSDPLLDKPLHHVHVPLGGRPLQRRVSTLKQQGEVVSEWSGRRTSANVSERWEVAISEVSTVSANIATRTGLEKCCIIIYPTELGYDGGVRRGGSAGLYRGSGHGSRIAGQR